jgi:hypothetical protein
MSDLLGKLEGFFNQDPKREEDYRDFERRTREDPNSISDEEAARRYREMMANQADDPADDEEGEKAFNQMPAEDRRKLAQRYREANDDNGRSFQGYNRDMNDEQASSPRELSRMTREAARNDPDLLESVFGKNSPLSSTAGKAALAGLAAIAARKFLSGRR